MISTLKTYQSNIRELGVRPLQQVPPVAASWALRVSSAYRQELQQLFQKSG
jgi:hypothetical protein